MLVTLMAILALQTATPEARNANCFVNGAQTSVPCAIVVNRNIPGTVIVSFGFGNENNVHYVGPKVDARSSQVTSIQVRNSPRVPDTGVCIADSEAASCMVDGLQIIGIY